MRALSSKLILLCGLAMAALPASAALKAGAVRIDVTPAVADLPLPYDTVYDRIYLRTVLIENGDKRVAIVDADVPMVEGTLYNGLVAQIARDAQTAEENVLFAISHAHNSLRVDTSMVGKTIPFSLKFNAALKEAISQSIAQAKAKMEPVRMGFGKGKASLAVNRNVWLEKEQRYAVGVDRAGKEPFDPTVDVFRFDNIAGVPVAFLVNYGIEPVVNLTTRSEISGDLPGAVSRYVEERYGDKVVTAFFVGAPGQPMYSAGPPAPGMVNPSTAHEILSAMGTLLGEEVLAISAGIRETADNLPIKTGLKVVECPGKITTPLNLGNSCAYSPQSKLPPCRDYKDQETGPTSFRLGMLRIGDVAIVHADSNIAPKLEVRLIEESPLASTVVTSANFGPAWFIVDDAAYPLNTYEATASRMRKGCAEKGFMEGALGLIRDSR